MKFADWPSRWGRVLRFREPVGRLAFFLGLLSCLVVKQGLDRWVLEWLGVPYSRRIWSILLGVALPTEEDLDWGWPLLATSLPFVWIGLALTAGRLRALHRSAAWALLFFVPVVKFMLVLLLLALPDNTMKKRKG